jgi:large subunit ribosomal protein L24
MVIDPTTGQPTRVKHKIIDGKSVRVGAKSGEQLDAGG